MVSPTNLSVSVKWNQCSSFFNPELCPSCVTCSSELFVCTSWKVKTKNIASTFEIKFNLPRGKANNSLQPRGSRWSFSELMAVPTSCQNPQEQGSSTDCWPVPPARTPPSVLQVLCAAGMQCWWHWAPLGQSWPGPKLPLEFGADICIFAGLKLCSPEEEM